MISRFVFFVVACVTIVQLVHGFRLAPTATGRATRLSPLRMAEGVTISAKMVSDLRAKTDAPMMECKKALTETKGDMDKAEELLRVKLGNKAAKVGGRIASQGICFAIIEGNEGILFESNCETDFVSKNPDFLGFTKSVAKLALKQNPSDLASLSALTIGDSSVEKTRADLVGKIGENMSLRRFKKFGGAGSSSKLASYVHGGVGEDRAIAGSIGVIVEYEGSAEAAKDIAMHVACNKPIGLSPKDVPEAVIENERKIATMKAAESGKKPEIVTKMIEGSVQKYLKEVSLLNQPFVKDPAITCADYLKSTGTEIKSYAFYVVGEGLEKKEDTFVAEVAAAQAKIAAAAAAAKA